jgi:hypothetical protein
MMVERHNSVSHGMRFTATLLLVCLIPAYSLTHLPISMIVGMVCEFTVLLTCAIGAGLWIAKCIRGLNLYRKRGLRPGKTSAQLVLTIVFLLLCIGRLAYRPPFAAVILVMALITALGLAGGAWLFGFMLQWLWRVTTPRNGFDQGSAIAHGGARATSRS